MAEGGQPTKSSEESVARAVQSQQQVKAKEWVEAHTVVAVDDNRSRTTKKSKNMQAYREG